MSFNINVNIQRNFRIEFHEKIQEYEFIFTQAGVYQPYLFPISFYKSSKYRTVEYREILEKKILDFLREQEINKVSDLSEEIFILLDLTVLKDF